jgi:hypothetical protein
MPSMPATTRVLLTPAAMRWKACRFTLRGYPRPQPTGVTLRLEGVRADWRRGGRLAAVGAVCFLVALGWWFGVVNTANAEVGRWAVDAVPSDWRRWRVQWEFGHAAHFLLTFAGFLALLGATVRVGAPDHRRVPGRS